MKKISLTVLSVLLGTIWSFAFSPEPVIACVSAVFGPESFIRTSRGPVVQERQFQVQYPHASKFTLHVFYEGIKKDFEGIAPSAVVALNGKEIVTPAEFNRNVHYIRKPVTLSETNALSVELRGKPGAGVRVVITARDDKVRTFDFRKIIQPDGGNLFGPDLNYIWTILEEPETGSAVLSDPFSSAPSLGVARPGEYTLELRIRGDSWESEPFIVKLAASYYNPYVPVPLKTRVVTGIGVYSVHAIHVGADIYIAPDTGSMECNISGFHVLVLDRATLDVKEPESDYHRTFCNDEEMDNFLKSLDSTSLVIVSSLLQVLPGAFPRTAVTLQNLGATDLLANNYYLDYILPDGTNGHFTYSLIGIPGLGRGQGVELNNWEHRAVSSNDFKINSDIEGYFVQDAKGKWTFIHPDFRTIETRTATSATSNTIKVGGFWNLNGDWIGPASYVSRPLLPDAVGGFQVLVLDRDTLAPAQSLWDNYETFSTNFSTVWNPDGLTLMKGESEQQRMLNYLSALPKSDHFVVVIASIGQPINRPIGSSYWPDVIRTIANYYGGTIGVLNRVNLSYPTYSLVGVSSQDAHPLGANASVEASLPGVNLRVAMHKDKQGWYEPV